LGGEKGNRKRRSSRTEGETLGGGESRAGARGGERKTGFRVKTRSGMDVTRRGQKKNGEERGQATRVVWTLSRETRSRGLNPRRKGEKPCKRFEKKKNKILF